jgi:hypothetical protein
MPEHSRRATNGRTGAEKRTNERTNERTHARE